MVKAFGISDIKHYKSGGLIPPELVVLLKELIGFGDIVHLNFNPCLPPGTPEVFIGNIHKVWVL